MEIYDAGYANGYWIPGREEEEEEREKGETVEPLQSPLITSFTFS